MDSAWINENDINSTQILKKQHMIARNFDV
jgi:hypothetical protein